MSYPTNNVSAVNCALSEVILRPNQILLRSDDRVSPGKAGGLGYMPHCGEGDGGRQVIVGRLEARLNLARRIWC